MTPNNPLKYTDPSSYRRKPDGWDQPRVALNGGISPGGRMGPGSGKHWSDGFHGSYSYNWRSGLYLDNRGGVVSYETAFNNYIQPNSSLPSEGKYAIGSISLGSRGIWLQYTIQNGYDDLKGVNSQANELFGSETINRLIGFSRSLYQDFWDDATEQGGSNWVNTTNNINTGIGVGTGVLGGNYGLTANQTFRYAQRINGRVVSAAELTAAHTLQSLKVAEALGRVNLVTGVLGSAYSTGKAISDYNRGGWNNVNGLDVADAGVGWAGVGVGVLATLGMVSNPVGWCVSIGTGIYFGARLVYDLSVDRK